MKISYKGSQSAICFGSLEEGDTFYDKYYDGQGPLIKVSRNQAYSTSARELIGYSPEENVLEVPTTLVTEFKNPYYEQED